MLYIIRFHVVITNDCKDHNGVYQNVRNRKFSLTVVPQKSLDIILKIAGMYRKVPEDAECHSVLAVMEIAVFLIFLKFVDRKINLENCYLLDKLHLRLQHVDVFRKLFLRDTSRGLDTSFRQISYDATGETDKLRGRFTINYIH